MEENIEKKESEKPQEIPEKKVIERKIKNLINKINIPNYPKHISEQITPILRAVEETKEKSITNLEKELKEIPFEKKSEEKPYNIIKSENPEKEYVSEKYTSIKNQTESDKFNSNIHQNLFTKEQTNLNPNISDPWKSQDNHEKKYVGTEFKSQKRNKMF